MIRKDHVGFRYLNPTYTRQRSHYKIRDRTDCLIPSFIPRPGIIKLFSNLL
ncbi:hypothetical protein [Aphanothece sacrum]|uniref:hypothetical protein n=1 Tax=Aphanothece sacrum TaxID=1122 RepID=UPI0015628C66|nr:hypothetical protein [Aphanothece sacrum]